MDIRALRYFVELVREQSFTRASEKLFVTQPTISKMIRNMEEELGQSKFLASDKPTVADVAAYSYIAHAPEGNVSLDDYANLRAWLARVEALPGFVGMPRTVAGLQKTA